ncbi:hypothetical protein KRE40_11135 [Elizabethkingia meningoseptica]|uniref:hypothetical protein n=1 Tax=Elizabethkingia meningoseptica TaxID=238 RepID=UPI0022F17169|nr:hypothetical protein [Elizabethkingia meningoseptica]EJK5329987.1 hypothetical protein [Elizabethkingia meningoseptica]MDE5439239.1 hypothetical protein [Elizabethkingia meningoseptica]MDE5468567.1 hypothetical protein [Elizabethkingia meningoseptica]MDE5475879.1 hypothetical protein [Elizabethkingia meningoseptica]MDE5478814.1 hypothetical protein [Elizabethkingia meningoseptica]
MKKINKTFLISIICFVSCKNIILPKDIYYNKAYSDSVKGLKNKELVLLLYKEDFNKNIEIRTDLGEIIYKKNNIEGGSRLLSIKIPETTKNIFIFYNKKNYRINIEQSFKYIFVSFRKGKKLDVAYSNEMPEYTD